jgi:uncharacterized protein YhbP (UPF0306 family)
VSIGFDEVERALRQHTFGTLSTLTERGAPHATGVVYAMSAPGEPLALYVTTRTTTRKVRNLRAHADVAFVIPVPRRFVSVFPPRAIQFQGTATVVPAQHEDAVRAFSSSWFLRRIRATEQHIVAQGGELCFIRIRPERMLFTYGMGMSVLSNVRQPRAAIGRVTIPANR